MHDIFCFTRAVLNVHMGSYISDSVDPRVDQELAPHCTASSLHFLVRLLLTRSIAFGNENGRLPSRRRKEGKKEEGKEGEERRKGATKNATSLSAVAPARGKFPPPATLGINRPSCGINSMFTTRLRPPPHVHFRRRAVVVVWYR